MSLRRVFKALGEPRTIRKVNGWAVVVWLLLAIPTILLWRDSVLWVAILSLWANIISHYTAWLTARVEVREERVEIDLQIEAEVVE